MGFGGKKSLVQKRVKGKPSIESTEEEFLPAEEVILEDVAFQEL